MPPNRGGRVMSVTHPTRGTQGGAYRHYQYHDCANRYKHRRYVCACITDVSHTNKNDLLFKSHVLALILKNAHFAVFCAKNISY